MAKLPVEQAHALAKFSAGRFVNATRIGSGNHATVWRAWDEDLQREVACKATREPPKGFDEEDGEALAQLNIPSSLQRLLDERARVEQRYSPLREARLLALVDHPNVVTVLEVGILEGGKVGVVMPLLTGGSLEHREWTEPWQDVLQAALRIGRGLAAIHAAGVLHRDLKPNNILFDSEDRPRIIDLGLSCLINDHDAMADWVGTREYQAPEVLAGRSRDVRDDLYAYCMIVYKMLYGQPAFATAEDRERGRVSKATREDGMPRRVHAILVRGLACDADRRWPDMPTLLRALERTRRPARRYQWAVATAALAATFAIGTMISARVVQAESCEDVTSELDPIWDKEIQTELRGAFGTRKPGDALSSWASRWVAVRARECEAAKRDDRDTGPSPCSASLRERFDATLHAFRTPHLRRGLHGATVIAELPAPEYCNDHGDDDTWGSGGLLELSRIDIEVGALVGIGDLEVARGRQRDYMELALGLRSEYGVTRAIYWRGEIRRLSGELDDAKGDFERVYESAQALGVPIVGAEAMMKLTAIAGAQGELRLADGYALAARAVLAVHQPERVAELMQTHALALLSGSEPTRARAVELLRRAVELREDQLREHGGTQELLSQAHESYARGLLAVHRANEALEYLELALSVHQDEYGHGTWRTRGILRHEFLALLELEKFIEAKAVWSALLENNYEKDDWQAYVEDAHWLGEIYVGAGAPHRAVLPLTAGREIALARALSADIARFDAALAGLVEG